MAQRNSGDPDPLVHISSTDSSAEESSPLYELRGRVVWFSDDMRREHRRLKSSLWHYIRHSRFFVALTSPLIYGCVVPFVLLDIFVSLYQAFSFPIYGIPKVVRSDYLMFDRGKLCYLNFLERLNCQYCAYANGLLAYVVEIAGRTEQHWCPIKHAHRNLHPHSRYSRFLPYGNAAAYRERIEEVRQDFKDIKK